MNISMIGLGYVGCVGAACLAKFGHRVIGCDVTENKVRLLNEGKPTIIEAEVGELVGQAHSRGLLSATQDLEAAVVQSDITFIAVGTPSTREGHLNLDYIFAATRQIGKALRKKAGFHIVAIRSTVLPGTNERVREILEAESGKRAGEDFAVVSNPEFLREGSAVKDFLHPPLTLIGTDSPRAEDMMRELYRDVTGEFIATDIRVAEIMKYVDNAYHGLKIVFANEVGNICKALGIDSHKVMEIFCKDTQLNISPYYFKPGFAFGGSCLPKDTRALRTLAHDLYVEAPVIDAISPSNEMQKRRALEIIERQGKRNIGILGLSFKAGTDDLRCSPILDVMEALIGKGYRVRVYDKNVSLSQKTNTNADFIAARLPHLHGLITDDLDAVCRESGVLVIVNRGRELDELPQKYPGRVIVDLARQYQTLDYPGHYEGISWANINQNPAQEEPLERDFAGTDY